VSLIARGKVRDIHSAGDDRLVLIASDRISAYDVILPTPIPDKGRVLTGLSAHWLTACADIVPGHLLSTDPDDMPPEHRAAAAEGRAMLVERLEMLPIECVARG
jgi:phosphoribosylaminoimidazole-succinocarboxamide synthase